MPDLAALRKEYALAGFSEEQADPDPIAQFNKWFAEAEAGGVVEPNAMTLATVDEKGFPGGRTVLLKGLDARGFVFYTNYDSAKGQDLAANPRATLVFPWLALERQVVVRGTVTRISREETAAYFQSRPIGSQLGAWASAQSTVVPNRATLEQNLHAAEQRFAGQPIPPPSHWGGFRVAPIRIEFWQGRPNRLHDRIRYRRDSSDHWLIERLSP